MELKIIPEFPYLRIDLETLTVYNVRHTIRALKPRGKYKSLTLTDMSGKTVGTTIYRLAWCAKNGIPHSKIPTDYCFCSDGRGGVKIKTRSEVNSHPTVTKQKLTEFQTIINHVSLYLSCENLQPLLDDVNIKAERIKKKLIYEKGYCEAKADMAVTAAQEEYFSLLHKGYIEPNILRFISGHSLKYLHTVRLKEEWIKHNLINEQIEI